MVRLGLLQHCGCCLPACLTQTRLVGDGRARALGLRLRLRHDDLRVCDVEDASSYDVWGDGNGGCLNLALLINTYQMHRSGMRGVFENLKLLRMSFMDCLKKA